MKVNAPSRRAALALAMLTTAGLGLLTGCTPAPAEPVGGSSASAPASGKASTQDSTYLAQAHQGNLAEIAAGQLAQQKAHNQAVKDLGARFVADHTQLDQSLQQVATALGVTLPTAPNAEQQALAQQYSSASGDAFDKLFVTTQLTAHMKAMQAGTAELASGSDATVKKAAQDAAPVIANHGMMLDQSAQTLGLPDRMTLGSASPSPSPS
jgi:putative membrane protein